MRTELKEYLDARIESYFTYVDNEHSMVDSRAVERDVATHFLGISFDEMNEAIRYVMNSKRLAE